MDVMLGKGRCGAEAERARLGPEELRALGVCLLLLGLLRTAGLLWHVVCLPLQTAR